METLCYRSKIAKFLRWLGLCRGEGVLDLFVIE